MFQDEGLRELGTIVVAPERDFEPACGELAGEANPGWVRESGRLQEDGDAAAWGALGLAADGRRRSFDDEDEEDEDFYDVDDDYDDEEEDDDFYDDDFDDEEDDEDEEFDDVDDEV
jgi:hypothetical protein